MTKSTKKTAAKAADDKTAKAKKKTASKKTAASKKTTAKAAVKKTVAKKKAPAKKKTVASKKTPAATTSVSRKPSAGKTAAASTTAKLPAGVINAAQRHAMIAEAAYLHAEAHGFGTDSHANWVHAESEIDARLARDGIVVKD